MEEKQKTLILSLKKKSPPKVRRRKMTKSGKDVNFIAQEEKMMIDKLGKVMSLGIIEKPYRSLLLEYSNGKK